MYDLLSPLEWIKIFFSIHLVSVHDPAKSQQYSVIFVKSAADAKNCMFFRDRALFMADTVQVNRLQIQQTIGANTWSFIAMEGHHSS